MSAALLSFIAIVLFMIHEFEEVIWVVPWITKNTNNPTFAKEMFMLGKASYPSSETMALLILEEFMLASFILLIGIFLKKPEIVAAVTLGHTLHLLSHLSELFRFQTWVPGTITAALTLPILLIVLYNFFKTNPINWLQLSIWTVVILVLLLANLSWLHSQAQNVERWLH